MYQSTISLGAYHTGILLEDGTVRLFGDHDDGRCTLPDLQGRKVKGLALGGYHTGLLLEDGTVRLFGGNDRGQSTLPDLPGLKVASDVVPLSSQLDKQADEADQRKKTVRYLVFGGPGLGKSTLINCLAGKVLFSARPSADGQGVTRKRDSAEIGGRVYVDIPGLSDVAARDEAAREMTGALREGGRCKILFLCGERQGRIVPEDKVTLALVLAAAPEIQQSFGVVVNQCGRDAMERQKERGHRKLYLQEILKGLPSVTPLIFFNPRDPNLDGKTDAVVALDDHLLDFVESLPVVTLHPERVGDVDGESYEDKKTKLLSAEELNRQLMKQVADHEEAARGQRENRAGERRRNARMLLIAASLASAMAIPAAMASLGFFGLDKITLVTVHVGGGTTVRINAILFPYFFLFLAYKVYSAIAKCMQDASNDMAPFEIMNRKLQIQGVEVKNWHIFLLASCADALTDTSSCRSFLLDPNAALAAKVVWTVSTAASIIVPLLYAKGVINHADALLFQLTLEDIEQTIVSVWEVCSDFAHGDELAMAVAFSCLFALLSIPEGIGVLRAKLQHREQFFVERGDEQLLLPDIHADV